MEDRSKEAFAQFNAAQNALESGDLDRASDLFDRIDYEAIERVEPDDALAARVLALQLCVLQERYKQAMYHADAALDLAENEPLIHHLAGQALWAEGHHRSGAEMLVFAAELLDGAAERTEPFQFQVDPAQVYYYAAEACSTFEKESAAEQFYHKAMQFSNEPAGSTSL
jgi:predicted Zn-dependent protease